MAEDGDGSGAAPEVLGPFIDRTFRLVEMIGIIALLGLVLKQFPRSAAYTTFVGELVAFIYWLEPITNAAVCKACGAAGPKTRLLTRLAVVLFSAIVTIWTIPFVRQLTESIKMTLE